MERGGREEGVDFYGKGEGRFEVVLEVPCISREGGLADIKNGG